MRAILKALQVPRVFSFHVLGSAVLWVWMFLVLKRQVMFYAGGARAIETQMPMHMALFATLIASLAVWGHAYYRGWVAGATAAGFRLALAAFVGRQGIETSLAVFGFDWPVSVYDAYPSWGPFVWFSRNMGLALYAYGLTMVAIACAQDVRLRRSARAWARSPI